MDLGRVGLVCRFKPVHLGHQVMLEALAARASHLTIGIGSSNRRDLRNPFTAAETRAMVEIVLAAAPPVPYRFLEVPDLDDGPRWRVMVRDLIGPLDLFVTANDYVRRLLAEIYEIAHPASIVAREDHVAVDGTLVRRAMARGEAWEDLVPARVAAYLKDRGLDARFRREFGLATLALEVEKPQAPTEGSFA